MGLTRDEEMEGRRTYRSNSCQHLARDLVKVYEFAGYSSVGY